MALKDFDTDSINASETPENRVIRSQLRLSSAWKVIGKMITGCKVEYSDEHPDIPEVVDSDDLVSAGGPVGLSRIFITAVRRKNNLCPCCRHACSVLRYETRTLRHVDDLGCKCFLVVNLPVFKCPDCGKTPRKRFPAAFPRASYTREFAKQVLIKLKTSSRSATAAEMHTTTDIVDAILDRAVEDGIVNQDLSHVTGIYLDETQFGSGHDYISVFTDQRHKVIFVCHGRKSDVLQLFLDHLVVQGGDPESIRFFSTDMSQAYESGIMELFPNATLVWDRFHLAKAINDALNDVRKRSVRRMDGESLKSVKYVVLHRQGRMKRKHIERFRLIRMTCPDLALAFDMKETFLEIIKVQDPVSMRRSLEIWIDWVLDSGPNEFKKKALRFREKMDRILAWTAYPISNSVSEGINKNIQDIRRQACGYRNLRNFFDMILFRQGDLTYRF